MEVTDKEEGEEGVEKTRARLTRLCCMQARLDSFLVPHFPPSSLSPPPLLLPLFFLLREKSQRGTQGAMTQRTRFHFSSSVQRASYSMHRAKEGWEEEEKEWHQPPQTVIADSYMLTPL